MFSDRVKDPFEVPDRRPADDIADSVEEFEDDGDDRGTGGVDPDFDEIDEREL